MGSKGSTTQRSNSTQSYAPTGGAYINNALDFATNAAATPFQSYGGPLVAGLSPTQLAGISNINQNAGFALPFINEAADYARAGAQNPMANIGQFFNPFTQQVVDATRANFDASNQVQQSQLLGNARAQSGVGGDRLAIAQAELAKQQRQAQDPMIAGLYSQGFNQALAAAQQFQQAQANAAYGLGSLGTAGQNAALTGANAQLGAGALEQGTQQAGLSADYGQFLRQVSYPLQQSQFLTQAVAGLAPSLGGTQTGQSTQVTTPPPPNPLSQIAGLGLTAAGIFTGNPMMAAGGAKGAMGGGGKGSTPMNISPGQIGGLNAGLGGLYADGGSVGAHDVLAHALRMADAIRRHRNGGAVMDAVMGDDGVFRIPGFADGGVPDELVPAARIADAFGGVSDAIASGDFDPQGANASFPAPPVAGVVPFPRPRPAGLDPAEDDGDVLPPNAQPTSFYVPGVGPAPGAGAPGLSSEFAPALREAITALQAPRPQPGFAGSPGAALMAAGLGMLASKSPYAGVGIGEGGMQGLATLERQRKAEREEADAAGRQASLRGNLAAHGITAEQAAQRLIQSAKQHADQLAETARHHQASEGHAANVLAENRRHREVQEQLANKPQLTVVGRDEYGNPRYGIFNPRDQSVKDLPKSAPGAVPALDIRGQATESLEPPKAPPAQITDESSLPSDIGDVGQGDATVLAGLPDRDQRMVKAIVEGRQPIPSARELRTPYWQRMVELANSYDPNFDMSRWQARVQTRKNFATGVEGRTIRSLNTVANHLDELDEASKKLDNWKTDSLGPGTKVANQVTNWYRENRGDPRITRFDTAANAVSTELEKAFRGNQTAISGIKEWRKAMSHTMSPEQMRESNRTLAKLLHGQLEGLAGQYKAGMGVNADALTILQPGARKTFERLLGTALDETGQEKGAGAADSKPEAGGAPARPANLPPGPAQYSAKRRQWKVGGKIYDADGKLVQ